MRGRSLTLKEDIARALLFAQCLEPHANKAGCTTRVVDSTAGTKLEYFTVSAVNSLWPFLDLVDRLLESRKQPTLIFDVAYEAQRRSARNRNGGKVNYASILMLLPLVVGQCLLQVEGGDPYCADATINRGCQAMRDTGAEDVDYLQQFVDYSRELSKAHHRRQGTSRNQWVPKFSGVYSNVMDAMFADQFSHMNMAKEVSQGYPYSRRVLTHLCNNHEDGLLRASETIYPDLRNELGRHDIAADCIVTGFYLAVFAMPGHTLFP